MSKILRSANVRQLSHIVQTKDNKQYLVDSRDTWDSGLEIMVFKMRRGSSKVTDWKNPVFESHPKSYEELYKIHHELCENLETYV